jgi:PHD/YefM family antitoxin component YafN of YafNO toxin-antitoxin module
MVRASDVKKRGVKIFDEELKKSDKVIINVRGKNKYVVIDMERYEELVENELDRIYDAIAQEIEDGRYHNNLEKHIEKIENV